MTNKQLYWTAEGQEGIIKKFIAVEGNDLKLENADFDLFTYTHKDGTVFIVEKSCGLSISKGSSLKEAIEEFDLLIEKQGHFEINEKIKIQSEGMRKVPNDPPTHVKQFVEVKNVWNEDLGTSTKILVYHD